MRLYLSSFQLGAHPERFTDLVGGRRRGWLIMNALDQGDERRRQHETARQLEHLAGIGLTAAELDLRDITPATAGDAFGEPDFVWVRGGNVFTLRMAMARSGMDEVLVSGLRADRFVYAGFSAGPCVLAPSLAGLEHCDPTEDCRRVYGDVRFDGLGVLDRPFVPHLDTPDHPESAALSEVAAAYRADHQPFWALRDGQALVIDGSHSELR